MQFEERHSVGVANSASVGILLSMHVFVGQMLEYANFNRSGGLDDENIIDLLNISIKNRYFSYFPITFCYFNFRTFSFFSNSDFDGSSFLFLFFH